MRLVVTENISLDGVIEATGGWFAPAGGDEDLFDVEEQVREHMRAQDALLLGRETFEQFRGYWPAQTEDATGITDHLNRVAKYVVSATMQDPQWVNTTVLRGPLADDIAALKDAPGNEVGVTGSIQLVHALTRAGLVEEYRLFLHPVVVAQGRRLFPDGHPVSRLSLLDSTPFRSGQVLLRYAPA